MKILAIDPGNEKSAFVVYENGEIIEKGIVDNYELKIMLVKSQISDYSTFDGCEKLYIEMIASYGMAVGKTVFETCVWIGRFIQAWGGDWEYIYRKDVKMHLCHTNRAKDSNVRQALMDLYGGTREIAIGTKKAPGPLYGVSKDVWAALGVAVTASAMN